MLGAEDCPRDTAMRVAAPSLERTRTRASAPSLTLLQTTVPAYRQAFLETLDERLGGHLRVLAGNEFFDPTIRIETDSPRTAIVRNRYLLGRRLLWQHRTIAEAVRADLVVAELNPRILSTWLVLLLRRALGRPIVLWGHAWSRRRGRARSTMLRHLMQRFASAVLVYTQTEARDLRRLMPGTIVEAAPNALYPLAARPDDTAAYRPRARDLVFVGRLVESKKPRLLLDAFVLALEDLPPDTRLVVVGDGPLRHELQTHVASYEGDRVLFTGALSRVEDLDAVYSAALASVIPGSAGLSLIQSLWFGVPAVIARDDPHGPELEAAVEGVNAVFFTSDSVTSLRDALVEVTDAREAWRRRRGEIARECASRYSVELMADAFVRVVEAVTR
jgi:glycosyltransferase involved in cell wall biosynthesis